MVFLIRVNQATTIYLLKSTSKCYNFTFLRGTLFLWFFARFRPSSSNRKWGLHSKVRFFGGQLWLASHLRFGTLFWWFHKFLLVGWRGNCAGFWFRRQRLVHLHFPFQLELFQRPPREPAINGFGLCLFLRFSCICFLCFNRLLFFILLIWLWCLRFKLSFYCTRK